MGDIPDVSSYLKSVPVNEFSSTKHTPETLRFAMELEHRRKDNEELNKMIASVVSSFSAKMKLQMGKVGMISKKLMESKDELQTLKVSRC